MNPSDPMPSFVDGWGRNSWHGIGQYSPSASGIPTDSMLALDLEYTVSGTQNASTLTISAGDQSKGGGDWGGVIMHDDGTYGLYTITSLSGGTCTVFPNVEKTITNKTLRNLGSGINGQHYTEPGYRALARHIFRTTRSSAYALRYAAKWDSQTGEATDWTVYGGMGANEYSISAKNSWVGLGNKESGATTSRNRRTMACFPASASANGKGVTKTFSLGGNSGFLEAFVSRVEPNGPYGFAPFRVVVVVDSVTLLDQTYTANAGLQRIVVPYSNGNSGAITITCASNESNDYPLNVDTVTWWAYDRVPSGWSWSDSVIDKNAKTVILGDSWTVYYPDGGSGSDGVLGVELQAAMTEAGGSGTVVSVGAGGTTAEYGLAVFDSLVAPENPQQVVFCYFTNDHNTYSQERWKSAIYKLARKCQNIGARPVFIMPLPTQSLGQTLGHGTWANAMSRGIQI